MSSIHQYLFDLELRSGTTRLSRKVIGWLTAIVRKYYSWGEVPQVSFRIGEASILLPWTHDLPRNLKAFPHYSKNIARIARELRAKYPGMTCLDIGANIGDTVAIIRNETDIPILCIEGNRTFLPLLEANTRQFNGVRIATTFVGDSDGTFDGEVVNYLGSSKITNAASRSGGGVAVKTLPTVLAEFPEFREFKYAKIDTDGFDIKILRSALATFVKNGAAVFFEYDPSLFGAQYETGTTVFADLAASGYDNMMIYENTGDYLLSLSTSDTPAIEDIHNYFSGRHSLKYCDICVFHKNDGDVFEKIRRAELEFFRKMRKF